VSSAAARCEAKCSALLRRSTRPGRYGARFGWPAGRRKDASSGGLRIHTQHSDATSGARLAPQAPTHHRRSAGGETSDSHPTFRRHKRRAPGPTSPRGAL
jgi:hypothetical protein